MKLPDFGEVFESCCNFFAMTLISRLISELEFASVVGARALSP